MPRGPALAEDERAAVSHAGLGCDRLARASCLTPAVTETSSNAGAERVEGYAAEEEVVGQHFSVYSAPEQRAGQAHPAEER